MSEPVKHLPPLPNARAIRARAAQWILERRMAENWSGDDQARLDEWLAQSPAHTIAYWRLDETWERTDRLAALKRPLSGTADLAARAPLFAKIAAAFAIAALIGGGVAFFALKPGVKTYATAVGGHEIVSFADGTRIELNTDTVLRTQMTTQSRTVWLDKGEAYFQVRHDAAHPFTVMIGGRRVTDLGTKFVVRRGASALRVAVVQGRVRFDAPNAFATKQTAMLSPGDVAIATANRCRWFAANRQSDRPGARLASWNADFHQATLAGRRPNSTATIRKKLVIADPMAAGSPSARHFRQWCGGIRAPCEEVFGAACRGQGK